MNNEKHIKYMKLAIYLAKKATGKTYPNPLVGCIIVKNNIIIGEGYHSVSGNEHAEIKAINSVKNKQDLIGSSFYITLEPCVHKGKQPPCTDSIIKAKAKEVIIPFIDTNPKVFGKGIYKLKSAGINVIKGILKEECFDLNMSFLYFHYKKKPLVIAKWAASLDGKLATYFNDSKWISSENSRKMAHEMRNKYQAILVGQGTLNIDNPQLTIRYNIENANNPIRIILAKNDNINLNSFVFTDKLAPTWLILPEKYKTKKIIELETQNIKIISTNDIINNNKFDFNIILKLLYQNGIQSIIVEGGRSILSDLLEQDYAQILNIFYGARVLGGNMNLANFINPNFKLIKDCQEFIINSTEIIDNTVFINAYNKDFTEFKNLILNKE